MTDSVKGEISCQLLPPGGSMGPNIFWKFYLVKNHKIAKNSTTSLAIKK
jgi:hypothetical protein